MAMFKKIFQVWMALFAVTTASAQGVVEKLTVYSEFKPAVIHMTNGRDIKNSFTNIFLKNASLLYKQGIQTMEANMDNIAGVDFDDHKFVKIDNMLACLLDTVGPNALFCATVIDFPAYEQMLRNNVNLTNFSLFDSAMGDQVSYTSLDLQDDVQMPLVNYFYYRFNGKFVRVHDREVSRMLSKEQKRRMKTIMATDGFTWVDRESLVKVLKDISSTE